MQYTMFQKYIICQVGDKEIDSSKEKKVQIRQFQWFTSFLVKIHIVYKYMDKKLHLGSKPTERKAY